MKNIYNQESTMRPLFTIITVCFNSEETISDTINSVLNQTCDNYEYIIIDGGSTDSTLKIIDSYKNKFKEKMKVVSEKDNGIYDAMNKGIALAKGEIIGLINSDDWYEIDALEEIKNNLTPSCSVYYGLMNSYSNGKLEKTYCHHPESLEHLSIAHPASFITAAAYSSSQLYDTRYKSAADYDFFIKLWQGNYEFKYLSKTLANFRTGGISHGHIGAYETASIKYKYGFISRHKYMSSKIKRIRKDIKLRCSRR